MEPLRGQKQQQFYENRTLHSLVPKKTPIPLFSAGPRKKLQSNASQYLAKIVDNTKEETIKKDLKKIKDKVSESQCTMVDPSFGH